MLNRARESRAAWDHWKRAENGAAELSEAEHRAKNWALSTCSDEGG